LSRYIQILFLTFTLLGAKETDMFIYDIPLKTIELKETTLKEFENRYMLIVNVASKCGFTKQYDGLEKLYQKYKNRDFVVLGFPCNQFASQEPVDEREIMNFCKRDYGVTFPMFAKIDVNGDSAHPLYKYLKSSKPGFLGTEIIKWNFTKFLVNKSGKVIERFSPSTTPEEIDEYLSSSVFK